MRTEVKKDVSATSSTELLKKLKELLKTDDSQELRDHIMRLSKAWGVRVRLPRKTNAA